MMKVIFFFVLYCVFCTNVHGQRTLPRHLMECYGNNSATLMSNKLPQNMHAFIGLLRKLESYTDFDVGAQTLALRILHRFRYDGIIKNPMANQSIITYAPNGFEYHRGAAILDILKNNYRYKFLNRLLTLQERCSLHWMISSSIDTHKRGDEATTCTTTDNLEKRAASTIELSKCPLASGVISTAWGSITVGSVLAEYVTSLSYNDIRRDAYLMTTMLGDLAEIALKHKSLSDIKTIITEGHWNSKISPRHYYIEDNQYIELTAAELRGDIDGLILDRISSETSTLRLSQIFDMYYGYAGLWQNFKRYWACDRASHKSELGLESIHTMMLRSASALHKRIYGTDELNDDVKKYINKTEILIKQQLNDFIRPNNESENCPDYENNKRNTYDLATDLTIYIDTNWPYTSFTTILTILLENLDISKFTSNFTLINANNGAIMINSTNSILDFYAYTEPQYSAHLKGFNLTQTIDVLLVREKYKLNVTIEQKIGGALSNIALFMPYGNATISEMDKQNCLAKLKTMRREVPDTIILFYTKATDKWANFTQDPSSDIITIEEPIGDATSIVGSLLNRMRAVPRRLINSQCGVSWSATGNSSSHTIYIEPHGAQLYKMHPNYFYTMDNHHISKIKISKLNNTSWKYYEICQSRTPPNVTIMSDDTADCTGVTSENQEILIYCDNERSVEQCQPLYLIIKSYEDFHGSFDCMDPEVCRYPKMTSLVINYENLRCSIEPDDNPLETDITDSTQLNRNRDN